MYVITEGIGTGRMAIVSASGERFEFPRADGGLIAAMLDEEFPACEGCEDREDVCENCMHCPSCADENCQWCDTAFSKDDDEDEACPHCGMPESIHDPDGCTDPDDQP